MSAPEQWYAYYKVDSGELESIGTELVDLPVGYDVKLLNGPPPNAYDWSPATLQFEPSIAPTSGRDRIAEFRNNPTVQLVMGSMTPSTVAELADVVNQIFGDVRYV